MKFEMNYKIYTEKPQHLINKISWRPYWDISHKC